MGISVRKKVFFAAVLLLCVSISTWAQNGIQDYIVQIMTYMKNNELMIYRDSSVLSSERAIHMFLNDKISRLGKNNYIEFLVRTKKNGLYRAYFLIYDSTTGNLVETLSGNIVPFSVSSNAAKNYYSMENLDALTILLRYRENETLSLEDYIYLLNNLLYKDATIKSMIEQKYANGETKSSDDKKRIAILKKDQVGNKTDIYNIAQLVIDGYSAQNEKLKSDMANQSIIEENKQYVETYKKLKDTMSKQLKSLRTKN